MPDLPPRVPPGPSNGPRRKKTAERGYDWDHQKTRARLITQYPVCQRCGDEWSAHLHHRDRNPFNRDPANLEMLGVKCHRLEHGGRA